MSSTVKNRQVRTFGGFLLRFSSLLYNTDNAGKIFIRAFSTKMSSTFKNGQVRTFGGFLPRFSLLLYNLDSAFVPKWGQRFFSQSIKYYETQKAHRKTKFCFSNQQSIGLPGASCYLCQYSLFPEPPAKTKLEKSENLQKDTFQKINFFSITQQLFAKLLSLSSNTVCHHWNRI